MKKVILALFIPFFLVACNNKETEIPFVQTQIITKKNYNYQKVFNGYLDKLNKTDLSFSYSGIIDKIPVSEGQNVKKGELLAKLKTDEFKLNLQKSKFQLNDSIIKFNRAKSYYERISKLHSAGGISYNDWENAHTDLKTSENKIKILKDEIKLNEQKEEFSKIYAPYDGKIIRIYKDDYQFVNSGDKVFSFEGNLEDDFVVRFFASQNDVLDLSVGDFVWVVLDVSDKKFKGKIKSISKTSLLNNSFRVSILLLENNPIFLTGMSANIFLDLILVDRIFIPISSLINEDDTKFVYLLNKKDENFGFVFKKEVKTGLILKDKIEVLSGLEEFDILIIDGLSQIMDGVLVKFK